MKNLLKVIIIIISSLMAGVIVYITIQDPEVDYNSIQSGYSTTGTKGQFVVYRQEDWTALIERILSRGGSLEDYPYLINGGSALGDAYGNSMAYGSYDVSNHNHIAHKQGSIGDYIVGSVSISKAGCGWCSLTSAMAELNDAVCGGITPTAWLSILPNNVKEQWAGGSMGWNAPSVWVKEVNSLGSYGEYAVVEQGLSTTTEACMGAINKYAGNSDCVVIVSTGNGSHTLFTDGGHIICVTDISDSGGAFHVDDSSGMANSNLKKAGVISCGWEDMCKLDFPLGETSMGGLDYCMKCYWVIQRVR